MKRSMIGLLEPENKLLDHFGREQTLKDIEKLCQTYRQLLEKIIPKYTYYFHRDFFEDEFQESVAKSTNLLKDRYIKVNEEKSTEKQPVYDMIFNRDQARNERIALLAQITDEFLSKWK